MITAAQVQHAFAGTRPALHRVARPPELCDRTLCAGVDIWGASVAYLATGSRPDYLIVVLPTIRDAVRIAGVQQEVAVRRKNALLLYLASAASRVASARRIFSTL